MTIEEFMELILLTSITAGLLTLAWLWGGKSLDKAGYLTILFHMLKVIQFFWLVPLVFFVLWYGTRNLAWWGGILFSGTPLLVKCARYLCVAWLAGLAKGLYDVAKADRVMRRLDRTAIDCKASLMEIFWGVCDELHINRKRVRLKQTYRVSMPFIAGVWKKTVYIPADANYSQETFRIVFLHELTHYRQGVVWLKRLTLLTQKFHFFNPVVRKYGQKVESWCEFACDYAVCRRLGSYERYWLAIIETMAYRHPELLSATYMAKGGSLLVARMERIFTYGKDKLSKPRPKAAAVLIICLMAVASTGCVTATSFGAGALYSYVYQVTNREYKDGVAKKIINTEYADTEPDDAYRTKTLEITAKDENEICLKGDYRDYKYKEYELDWKADGGDMLITSEFEVKSSTTVDIFAGINQSVEGKVAFGIIGPDNKRRYVVYREEDLCMLHQFAIDQPGTYQIYVRNCTQDALDGFLTIEYEIE